jgi:adenylate kinase
LIVFRKNGFEPFLHSAIPFGGILWNNEDMHTDPKTFVFIGRSGCGKGTQAALLEEYLKTTYPSQPLFYLEMGSHYRTFIQEKNHTAELAREIQLAGGLQPEFLSIWMWSTIFIQSLTGAESLILDGTPRRLREALVLDSAFKFYNRRMPTVLLVNVSEAWAKDRLRGRGRNEDSDEEKIAQKMKWYEAEVLPAVEFFRDSRTYDFLDINGEQPIALVHEEILRKLHDTHKD